MSYFSNFPLTFYSFGNGEERVLTQNIAAYVEVLDDVKLNSAFYQDYYVQGGERPDHVAFSLYKNPHMHWTFYLMNDKIREQGWPLQYNILVDKAKRDYPNFTITTQDPIHTGFDVGDSVTGLISNAEGTIVHKNLDLGQVIVSLNTTQIFQVPESVICGGDSIVTTGASLEYIATNHYTKDGEHIDLNLNDMSIPLNAVPKTNLDVYIEENNKLKQIRVITPSSINQVQQLFNDALRS